MGYDYLIVGAGFAGSVLAERLATANKKVLLVEQREHLGGNCYDFLDEAGILIHKYGPHIFHTNHTEVWDYLSQFTAWIPYQHRVLSKVDGNNVTLPVNLNTIYELFPADKARNLERKLLETIGNANCVPILELRKNKDNDLRQMAELVYEKIYLNYSRKQWGMDPDELDPLVTGRVPVWADRDNRYFKEKYQGMPAKGYTSIFEKIVGHPNIEIILNKDCKDIIGKTDYDQLIYTGLIDYFFDYKHGKLPYRSMNFKFETLNLKQFQEVAVINYPGNEPFMRITEFKHFTGQANPKTSLLREYPEDYDPAKNTPCYPIPKQENYILYQKYKVEAEKLKKVTFIGRLAEYCYYNMDGVVKQALQAAQVLLGR